MCRFRHLKSVWGAWWRDKKRHRKPEEHALVIWVGESGLDDMLIATAEKVHLNVYRPDLKKETWAFPGFDGTLSAIRHQTDGVTWVWDSNGVRTPLVTFGNVIYPNGKIRDGNGTQPKYYKQFVPQVGELGDLWFRHLEESYDSQVVGLPSY